jgi:twitching motility protein PilT
MSIRLSDIRLNEVLRAARNGNVSDIHFTAGSPPIFRVDGRIRPSSGATLSSDEIGALLQDLLVGPARKRFDRHKDVTISLHEDALGPLRLHAYTTAQGPSAAIRLLPKEIPSLESLHLPQVIGDLATAPYGLILFAGPTGSGKTTSLATLVDRINRTQARHIITIEDPIEYVHHMQRSIIHQRQIGRDVMSFESAIIEALRADPDVLLLGEMRSAASMHAALIAAETGHLVLATLHTSNAPQTIARMVDAFPPEHQHAIRTQLAQTIVAVVCQRLVPRYDSGRCCATEILLANTAVRNLIRDGKTYQLRNVIATNRALGMQTFEDALNAFVADGIVELSIARSFSERPDDISSESVLSAPGSR